MTPIRKALTQQGYLEHNRNEYLVPAPPESPPVLRRAFAILSPLCGRAARLGPIQHPIV